MLSVVVFIVALMDAEAFTQEQWKATVHAAEDQPMLGQKMAKEFLMIVAGHNATLNKNKLQAGIVFYDEHLNDLIDGNPGKGILGLKDMGSLVQNAMAKVVAEWLPMKALVRK